MMEHIREWSGTCSKMKSTCLKGAAAIWLQQQLLYRNAGPALPEFLFFSRGARSLNILKYKIFQCLSVGNNFKCLKSLFGDQSKCMCRLDSACGAPG